MSVGNVRIVAINLGDIGRAGTLANWKGFICGLRKPPIVALTLSLSLIKKSYFMVSSFRLSVCEP